MAEKVTDKMRTSGDWRRSTFSTPAMMKTKVTMTVRKKLWALDAVIAQEEKENAKAPHRECLKLIFVIFPKYRNPSPAVYS